MEIDTFRRWLSERGCHFDTQAQHRGEGHGHLTIHRVGRVAELPLTGSHHGLDADLVRGVCEKLGLSPLDLPKGRS
jgi:hypothetical protein